MCDNAPCKNGCSCTSLDYTATHGPSCTEDCDYFCTNEDGKFHLGKNCQFAEIGLQCGIDQIEIYTNNDVVSHNMECGLKF